MKKNYHKVTPHKLTPQQERAWKNSFWVLHDALTALGEDYKKLHLIFEYCLPQYPPKASGAISAQYVIRADCVVVSNESVVVLEFKDQKNVVTAHGFTTRRYRNRLHKFHDQSRGKRKWGILIPTLSEDVRDVILQRITACSPNRLAEELRAQFGRSPKSVRSIKQWTESTYSIHQKQKG